jgi:hypothetical protein
MKLTRNSRVVVSSEEDGEGERLGPLPADDDVFEGDGHVPAVSFANGPWSSSEGTVPLPPERIDMMMAGPQCVSRLDPRFSTPGNRAVRRSGEGEERRKDVGLNEKVEQVRRLTLGYV